jgi:hypothetical protein
MNTSPTPAPPALDPPSPSWALQESLQQAATKPIRRSTRLNPLAADTGSGGKEDTIDAPWWPGSDISQKNIITGNRTRTRRNNQNL